MTKKYFILLILLCTAVGVRCQTGYGEEKDIPYYDAAVRNRDAYIAERCMLDLYYPAASRGFATVVWFHGGGLTGGSKSIPDELKGKGFAVAAVNYRLYPKVKCPGYIEDAAAAVAWVFRNIEKYGGNAGLIFVAGHSAGAYLTSMTGLDKRWLNAHHIDADSIAGLIPLSGNAITHMTIREERGIKNTQPVVDEYAPMYHVRADAPPLILMTGDRELEMLGRYEENAYMLRMMKLVKHPHTVLYEFDGYGHDMTAPAFPLLVRFVNETAKNRGNRRN
ncbi:MAG: alpha/beta hydrolase [Bacteroidales bacterium]|nr:alpha/beta hydrolase [Bacteroidales bacterium]